MSARSFRRDRERRREAERRRSALRTRRAGLTAVAAGAFALTANVAPASAAPFEVNTLADGAPDACDASCTLRDAIEAADVTAEDDFITFQAGLTGTIRLTAGQLQVNNGIHETTIEGPGDTNPIEVSGDADDNGPDAGDSPVLHLDESDVYLSGLTLTEGYGDAAGAVYVDESSYLLLDNAAVTGSTATGDAIPAPDFDFYASGGGILNLGELSIEFSDIADNDSTATSGGPYLFGGGGIQNAGELEVSYSLITGNTAAEHGGGIFQGLTGKYNPSMEISNSIIADNEAYFGAGIDVANLAKYGSSDRNRISATTITGNDAGGPGGGIGLRYMSPADRWTITHSTIDDNGASYGGGMMVGAASGSANLVDSTISGNYAEDGGGIAISQAGQKYEDGFAVNNSTIAANEAGLAGGGIFFGGGPYAEEPTPLNSTIVADNSAGGLQSDLAQEGPADSGGADLSFSLVEEPTNAVIGQSPPGSSILGVDPQLGPLAGNGGPTLTHLPAVTSPVVDKGDSPGELETDQRFDPRRVDTSVANAADGTDIGSVELATGPPAPPTAPPAGATVKLGSLNAKKKRNRVVRTRKEQARIRVRFSSDVPGATFECKLDQDDFEPCESPFRARVASKPGKGAKHRVTIRARDAAGQLVGDPATVIFRVIEVGN